MNLIEIDPTELSSSNLSKCNSNEIYLPRCAESKEYATSIQASWKKEVFFYPKMMRVIGSPFHYSYLENINGSEIATTLYGHLIRPKYFKGVLPVVLFFHTGAGPHDVFLHWKASSLVSRLNCFVLIVDILSDETGWSWDDDRNKYNDVRKRLMMKDESSGIRENLRVRIHAAIEAITNIEGVNVNQLAAFGWDLGGQSIIELAQMNIPEMKVLVSFHGVFDGITQDSTNLHSSSNNLHVLICNGSADPFVSAEDLLSLQIILNSTNRPDQCGILNFPNVKHGFSNPAQKFNSNPSFCYDKVAAVASWKAATSLLQETFKEMDDTKSIT